jgi:hypothetical protein
MRVFAVLLLTAVGALHSQTIERSVVTSGAVRSSTGVIAMHGSIGQPIIGISRGAAQSAFHGFWYRLASVHSSIERAEPFAVRLGPQPAAESARLELGCSGDAEASLVTLQGRLVEQLVLVPTPSGAAATIDCSHYASGLYLLQLGCNGQRMYLPFVISK